MLQSSEESTLRTNARNGEHFRKFGERNSQMSRRLPGRRALRAHEVLSLLDE
jgi:hypothetical protein